MSLFPARLPLFSPGELRVGAQAGVWKFAHRVYEIRCPNKLFVSALCRLANQYAVESWRVETGERTVFNRRVPSSMEQAMWERTAGLRTLSSSADSYPADRRAGIA